MKKLWYGFFASGALVCVSLLLPQKSNAAAFTDIPEDHYLYQATEWLHEQGIMEGYADGTFRPKNMVTRAEALKIIITSLKSVKLQSDIAPGFGDVPKDAWYAPYVVAAIERRIIAGPETKTTFNPGREVSKAEFLKMFLESEQVDAELFLGDILLPIAYDVQNASEWYYPYMRYALASSMTIATEQGLLRPERGLNRAAIALFVHRFFLYRKNLQTSVLLAAMGTELSRAYAALDTGDLAGADFASARAKLQARGALEGLPDDALAQGAVHIAEGYRHIVKSYRAGAAAKYATAIEEARLAWEEAEKAKKFSATFTQSANNIQVFAKNAADTSRKRQ